MNQVYKITNKINDKVYVGITTQGANRRWSEHLYRFNSGERDHKIYLAMKKYGIDNVCSVGTYTTFQLKAALKDIARQRNIEYATVNYISQLS